MTGEFRRQTNFLTEAMKRRKFLWHLLAVMVAAVLSVGFTACKGDDDGNPGGGGNSSIVGTWEGSSSPWTFTVTFNSNGTGSARGSSKHGSTHIWEFTWSGSSSIRCKGPHSYVGSDGEVTSDTWDSTLQLSGNTLTGFPIGSITLVKR